jgi:hypothetical protein
MGSQRPLPGGRGSVTPVFFEPRPLGSGRAEYVTEILKWRN